jgi:cell division protease FtsH
MSHTPLADYAADHRFLVDAAAKAAGLTDPVAFNPRAYLYSLVGAAVRGPLGTVVGGPVRQWHTGGPK